MQHEYPKQPPPPRKFQPSCDTGASFIELLVSIVLLGTAAVAVLTALSAALIGARVSDEIAKSQSAVATVADYLTDTAPASDVVTYRDCVGFNPQTEYQAAVNARFGVGVVDVVAVRYWDDLTRTFTATCRYGVGDRLQELELRSAVNAIERSVLVVKRPDTVPTVSVVPPPSVPPYTGGSGQVLVNPTPGLP